MREALTTVFGVMLAALLAFWFDRQKRREENEFRLKQEAFFDAAEAVQRFFIYYMTIPDRTLPRAGKTDTEAVEVSIALNKLHFFCSLGTITCVTKFNALMGRSVTDAVAAKMLSGFIAEDVKVLDMRIASYEATNAQLQQETEILLQSDPNNPLIARYKHQRADTFRLIAECHGRKSELAKAQYAETEKCRNVVSQNLMPLSEIARELLLLARDELKFDIDRDAYHALMEQSANEGQQRLTNFIETIRSEVNGRMQ
jgi:hypothetical protein